MHQRLVHGRVERVARLRRTARGRACRRIAPEPRRPCLKPPSSSPCSRARPMSSSTGSSSPPASPTATSRDCLAVALDPLAVVGVLGLQPLQVAVRSASSRRSSRLARVASVASSTPVGAAGSEVPAEPAACPPASAPRPSAGRCARLSRIDRRLGAPRLGGHALAHAAPPSRSLVLPSSTISASTTSSSCGVPSGRTGRRRRHRRRPSACALVCAYIAAPIFWLTVGQLLRLGPDARRCRCRRAPSSASPSAASTSVLLVRRELLAVLGQELLGLVDERVGLVADLGLLAALACPPRRAASASRIIRSMSSFGSAEPPVIVIDCSLPVPRSLAETCTMPLASMSKVTSICGTPRGAGGRPVSSNMPSFLLYDAISRSPW